MYEINFIYYVMTNDAVIHLYALTYTHTCLHTMIYKSDLRAWCSFFPTSINTD